jgi:aspartate ammonia-lyase
MPGKINPVLAEAVAQAGIKVLGNDVIINQCVAMGQLELNQFAPMIAFSFLESLDILINTNKIFAINCIKNIRPNLEKIQSSVNNSTAVLTALLPKLGYKKITQIASEIQKKQITIKEYILNNRLLSQEEFDKAISAQSVLSLGHKG